MIRRRAAAVFALVLLAAFAAAPSALAESATGTVIANDGVPVAYQVSGAGEPALVFVHCWSCDRGYWSAQLPLFAEHHRVVAVDLGGHGESGLEREDMTIEEFGEDVAAVVRHLGLERAVLIGHSMGGSVIIEAALRLPGVVEGLIAVDTLQDVERVMTEEQIEAFMTPMRSNYAETARGFVGQALFPADADPELRDRVADDMAAAPPEVALSAMGNLLRYPAAARLEKTGLPLAAINSDRYPTNVEADARHAKAFKLYTMTGVGHFPHMERSVEFNQKLNEALAWIAEQQAK